MRIAFVSFISLLFVLPAIAYDDATFIEHSENGCYLIHQQGFKDSCSFLIPLDDPTIVWSNYVEWPIYTTSANSGDGYVFAGTYLNDPKEAQLFDLRGGGVPAWTYTGNEFHVDASDDGFILAALDENGAGINVIKWAGPGTGIPDWTADFPARYLGNYGPYIEVSRDGSTVAAILTESAVSELVMFDQSSSTPLVDYLASDLSFPRIIQLSSDGRYAGVRTNTHVYIYDRDLNAMRAEIYIGFGATPFDISGDGDLIAYGWSSLVVNEWNGVSYGFLWTRAESGYYLSTISISADGSTIVAGWYAASHNQARLTVHDRTSAVPVWTYDFITSSGLYQESIRKIEMSSDGRYIIAGSWGDDANLNPEVHVFDRDAGPIPYFTADMPGSVFSVDIDHLGRFATACGKHVHANVSGHGGDIIAIDMDIITSTFETYPDILPPDINLSVSPNPFNSTTVLSFKLPVASNVKFDIFDINGRNVGALKTVPLLGNQWYPAGIHHVLFDGAGLASGLYFCRLQAGEYTKTQKIVLMK